MRLCHMPRCSVSVTRSGQHQQQLILSPPSLRRILHGCVSGPDMLAKHACMQVFCDMKLINTREKISGKTFIYFENRRLLCAELKRHKRILTVLPRTRTTGFISHSAWLQLEYENSRPRNALKVASVKTRKQWTMQTGFS